MRWSADCPSCGWELSWVEFLKAFSVRLSCPMCKRVVSLLGTGSAPKP